MRLYFCGMTTSFQIRVCENPACGLRYPLVIGHPYGERCPHCLGSTRIALSRLINPEPVLSSNDSPLPSMGEGTGMRVEALLDNIRSAWNVGAIFRTSDGLGVKRLHLCGVTPTPENEAVRKTALGGELSVGWTYNRNALAAASQLKAEGCTLVALEQDDRAVPISPRLDIQNPMVLIVGNEVTGVDPELLDLCDCIIHIPMRGRKRSLNVEVAFGIAVHALISITNNNSGAHS
jgi:23S rRNA (guanosine2251-2'-O)-methyltransferase